MSEPREIYLGTVRVDMSGAGMTVPCSWDEGCEPYRAHKDDAGLDLRASERTVVRAGVMRMVGTGFRCNIPSGHVGLLFARSSLCKCGLYLANGTGVIDAGYIGEIMVPLVAYGSSRVIERGERVAQLVVVPIVRPGFVRVGRSMLGATDRGDGGFGSSGKGSDD